MGSEERDKVRCIEINGYPPGSRCRPEAIANERTNHSGLNAFAPGGVLADRTRHVSLL